MFTLISYLTNFRFKNGHEIHEDARIKITRDTQRIENYYLTLNLAKVEDAGTYEVKAANFIGETTSSCKVQVLSKYIFAKNVNLVLKSVSRLLSNFSHIRYDVFKFQLILKRFVNGL